MSTKAIRVLPLAVIVALVAWYVSSLPSELVTRYCEYGSVSEQQRASCEDHVSDEKVETLDTHAAQYARGSLTLCLDDAGPFCEGKRDGFVLDGPSE